MIKRILIGILLIVVAAVVGIALYQRNHGSSGAAYDGIAPANDSPEAIQEQLRKVETGDGLDADLRSADQDIWKL